ncbi:MAG: MarR family transcriptional regulator [Bordetella sp.]|nr:MarR family transcriptional regulator [Bordetella sp.]
MTRSAARPLYLIKRAETASRTGLEAFLQNLGVTPGQYTALSLLAAQRNQSSAEMARKAGVTPQSMSETISGLERKGLIVRAENPEHRRILNITLTEKGQALLAQCDARADALEERLLQGLSPDQVEILRQALQTIIQNHGQGAAA